MDQRVLWCARSTARTERRSTSGDEDASALHGWGSRIRRYNAIPSYKAHCASNSRISRHDDSISTPIAGCTRSNFDRPGPTLGASARHANLATRGCIVPGLNREGARGICSVA
jgi:hypothetical protein